MKVNFKTDLCSIYSQQICRPFYEIIYFSAWWWKFKNLFNWKFLKYFRQKVISFHHTANRWPKLITHTLCQNSKSLPPEEMRCPSHFLEWRHSKNKLDRLEQDERFNQDVDNRKTGLDWRRISSPPLSDVPEVPFSRTKARERAPVHIRLIGLAWAEAGRISSPHEMTEPRSLSPPSRDADDLLLFLCWFWLFRWFWDQHCKLFFAVANVAINTC